MTKPRALLIVGFLVVVTGIALFVVRKNQPTDDIAQESQAQTTQNEAEPKPQSTEYLALTGEEYKKLFLESSQPNTKLISEPPVITGDESLDKKIVQLAESRGYALQKVPRTELVETDGWFMQQKMAQSWTELKKQASENDIELEITSGMRTVEEQRELFISRLAGGQTDEQILKVLAMTAPPGYSRHHSGYVIDIADKSATVFEYSPGYKWISADNYLVAKKLGIIPSYPDGAENQGPEPEPWEYVWVGQELLTK